MPNGKKIMGKYLVNIYSVISQTNGDIIRNGDLSKVFSENALKLIKKTIKLVGYKYVGRFKDTYGRYYTKYMLMDEEFSLRESEVIYLVTITKLK
nr:MAG: hypothetical protein [Bacteriophage sp.]